LFVKYRYRYLSSSFIFEFRDRTGHFLNQLGAVYNCTEKAVSGIIGEMKVLFRLAHSYMLAQTAEKKGNISLILIV
jgi:hypothetical protein